MLGSAATFFLPETCDKDLPNTVNDANNFGIDQSYLDCILCTKLRTREDEVEKGEKDFLLEKGEKDGREATVFRKITYAATIFNKPKIDAETEKTSSSKTTQ